VQDALDKAETARRGAKAERQRRWRERAANRETPSRTGASLAMHLTDGECAALDSLAREIYDAHPHDPPDDPSFVFPGRAEAIRQLIREWRARNPSKRRPATRESCGEFWRAEASWRRNRDGEKASAPRPPWRRGSL
jgi:hypothetical protein